MAGLRQELSIPIAGIRHEQASHRSAEALPFLFPLREFQLQRIAPYISSASDLSIPIAGIHTSWQLLIL